MPSATPNRIFGAIAKACEDNPLFTHIPLAKSGDFPLMTKPPAKTQFIESELLAACKAGCAYVQALKDNWSANDGNLAPALDGKGAIAVGPDLDRLFFEWDRLSTIAMGESPDTVKMED